MEWLVSGMARRGSLVTKLRRLRPSPAPVIALFVAIRRLLMKDETCRICGQPYAHLFGCPITPSDRPGWSRRCPDTFPMEWLPLDQRADG
jgi:hypothetical protein